MIGLAAANSMSAVFTIMSAPLQMWKISVGKHFNHQAGVKRQDCFILAEESFSEVAHFKSSFMASHEINSECI